MVTKKAVARKKKMAGAMARAEQSGSDRTAIKVPGIPLFNPKAGIWNIDIVPFDVTKKYAKFAKKNFAQPGEIYWERTYWNHPRVGVNEDAHVCMAQTFNKKCYICEAKAKLLQDPKVDRKSEQVKSITPKERQLFLVYVHEEKEKGLQLWEIAEYNFGRQLDAKLKTAPDNLKTSYDQFYDPDGGYTLRVVGTDETGGGHKFVWFNVDSLNPRKKGFEPKKLLDHGIDLADVPNPIDYDVLRRLYMMIDEEDDETEESEEEETDEEEESEDETEEEESEEEEDETEEESEEEEDESEELTVGSLVTGMYKKAVRTGTITKIFKSKKSGNMLAYVEVDGLDKPWTVEVDELTLAEEEDEEEEKTEEEDEETEEEEEEETEEEEDEDEDEDEPFEDEEEEEKPKPGKKPGKKPATAKKLVGRKTR